VIVERQDANAKAYHSDVTARSLLSGQVDSPDWARGLIKALEACTGMPGGHVWVEDRPAHNSYLFGGLGSPGNRQDPLKKQRPKKGREISFPPASWEIESAESYFDQRPPTRSTRNPFLTGDDAPATDFETQFEPTLGSDRSSPFPAPEMTRPSTVVGLPLPRSSSLGTAKPGRLTRSLSSVTSPFSKTHKRSLTQVPSPLSNPASEGSTPQNFRGSDSFQIPANQPAWMNFGAREPETIQPVALHREGITHAIALHDFKAVEVYLCAI
jgi:SH3 domain-containing YSC84-like protein 1